MKMKKAIRMPLRRAPGGARGPLPPQGSRPLRARAATADEAYDEEDYEAGEEPNMKFSHALIVVLVLHLVAVGGVFAFNWIKAGQTAEGKSAKPAAPAAPAVTEKPATPEAVVQKPAAPATIAGWQGRTHTVAAGDTLTRIATVHGTTIEAIEKENGITSYSVIRVGLVLKIPGGEKSAPAAKTVATSSQKAANPSDAATKQAFIAAKTDSASVHSTAAPVKPAVAAIKPTATVVKPATGTISAVPKSSTGEAKAPPAKAAPAPVATGDTYVVAQGDNPSTIAKKLQVSYNELITVNNIKDPTKIQIGQKLKIPKK